MRPQPPWNAAPPQLTSRKWSLSRCCGGRVPPRGCIIQCAPVISSCPALLCFAWGLFHNQGKPAIQGMNNTQELQQPTASNWQELVYRYPSPAPLREITSMHGSYKTFNTESRMLALVGKDLTRS